MREISQEYIDYAMYRIEKSWEYIKAARLLLSDGEYASANNRAYYSVFQSVRAVLALDGFDSKKHSGVLSEFRRRYIKTGVFSSDISDMIGSAFTIRTKSDYEDMYIATMSEAQQQVENAEHVFKEISDYLKSEGLNV